MKDEGNINMYKYTRKSIISKGVGLNYKKKTFYLFFQFLLVIKKIQALFGCDVEYNKIKFIIYIVNKN